LGITISKDSSAEELLPIAMVFHELLGLPVTMRSLNKKGVRIEKGRVLDKNYTGPVLEQVLLENCAIRTIPRSGAYSGIPVVVSPIRDEKGSAVAAIGVVDVVGTIDLGVVFGNYPDIIAQVQACLRGRVTAP
jgi:hypothetical protein